MTNQQKEQETTSSAELNNELWRASVEKTLVEVLAVAEGRTDAFWSGFQQATEEIAERLGVKLPEPGAHASESFALRAEAEYNVESLERLSCEADDKGLPGIARIYQKAANTIRKLARARWGMIYDRERLGLLRAHGERIATGAADDATRLH
ncbi:hypothetical protein [Paraburkholderia sp. OV446]|uniref:hypothetical protein n=1 Tax=Paraburkholderia sp. SIMBA_053 TaxID=3085794 RepID=UPI000D8FA3B7